MAPRIVDVDAFAGGELVATLAGRPVRILPTCFAGVVYRRLVFPLDEGDFITLDDEPFELSELEAPRIHHAPSAIRRTYA